MNSEINASRYVPSGMNGHMDMMLNCNCEIFYTVAPENGKYYAIAYMGKSKNKAWYYSFKSEERMQEYINKYIEERRLMEANKVVAKTAKKVADNNVKVEVGQLFKYSWGYDQTNVDYFQVTEVKGKKVTLKAIESKGVEGTGGFMCCNVVPVKDAFITGNRSETITKMVKAGYKGEPYFSMPYGSLSITSEDQQSYCSWYA